MWEKRKSKRACIRMQVYDCACVCEWRQHHLLFCLHVCLGVYACMTFLGLLYGLPKHRMHVCENVWYVSIIGTVLSFGACIALYTAQRLSTLDAFDTTNAHRHTQTRSCEEYNTDSLKPIRIGTITTITIVYISHRRLVSIEYGVHWNEWMKSISVYISYSKGKYIKIKNDTKKKPAHTHLLCSLFHLVYGSPCAHACVCRVFVWFTFVFGSCKPKGKIQLHLERKIVQ